MSYWNFFVTFLGCLYTLSKQLHFLYVCQSVSWLTSLLNLDLCRDISKSGLDIFLKFSGNIPWVFVHYFQKVLNFLYVCQSVSWLTSLLKLYKYRDISSSGWDTFLKSFGDISGMLAGKFQIILKFLYVCQSVSWLTSFLQLHKYKDISSSGWDMFLKLFGDIPEMLVH